jgi:hypothetical protein
MLPLGKRAERSINPCRHCQDGIFGRDTFFSDLILAAINGLIFRPILLRASAAGSSRRRAKYRTEVKC